MNRSKNLIITLIIIIAMLAIALIGAIVYIIVDNDNGEKQIVVNNTNTDNSPADIQDEIEKVAMETFNEMFEVYEGTEIASSRIRLLLFDIETNNADEGNEHIVNINQDGITDMDQLVEDKTYTVETFYDDDGYINEIKITETTTEPTEDENLDDTTIDMGKLTFNSKFIIYAGDITGERLNSLLQEAMESNNNYPEHQITLTSNNLQTLEGIVATDIYSILFSYDLEGYVNNINIDKKM